MNNGPSVLNDFARHAQYDQYTRASRVYVNRAGAVASSDVAQFERIVFGDEGDDKSSQPDVPRQLASGNSPAETIAKTLGLLPHVTGL